MNKKYERVKAVFDIIAMFPNKHLPNDIFVYCDTRTQVEQIQYITIERKPVFLYVESVFYTTHNALALSIILLSKQIDKVIVYPIYNKMSFNSEYITTMHINDFADSLFDNISPLHKIINTHDKVLSVEMFQMLITECIPRCSDEITTTAVYKYIMELCRNHNYFDLIASGGMKCIGNLTHITMIMQRINTMTRLVFNALSTAIQNVINPALDIREGIISAMDHPGGIPADHAIEYTGGAIKIRAVPRYIQDLHLFLDAPEDPCVYIFQTPRGYLVTMWTNHKCDDYERYYNGDYNTLITQLLCKSPLNIVNDGKYTLKHTMGEILSDVFDDAMRIEYPLEGIQNHHDVEERINEFIRGLKNHKGVVELLSNRDGDDVREKFTQLINSAIDRIVIPAIEFIKTHHVLTITDVLYKLKIRGIKVCDHDKNRPHPFIFTHNGIRMVYSNTPIQNLHKLLPNPHTNTIYIHSIYHDDMYKVNTYYTRNNLKLRYIGKNRYENGDIFNKIFRYIVELGN